MQSQSPFGTPGDSPNKMPSRWAADDRFSHGYYLVRRKLMKLVGASFYVDDPSGNIVMYANQKGFKLKEDIRLYTGEDMSHELLTIRARKMLDISATYDVTDTTSGEKVGALRRKGLKSMIQDEWILLDAQDREIGLIQEDSTALALIRRFIDMATYFLPQQYNALVNGRTVATFKQTKNPVLLKLQVEFSGDTGNMLDRRLGLAAAVLLSAIEGKQH